MNICDALNFYLMRLNIVFLLMMIGWVLFYFYYLFKIIFKNNLNTHPHIFPPTQ
jgi:hypothetical protein